MNIVQALYRFVDSLNAPLEFRHSCEEIRTLREPHLDGLALRLAACDNNLPTFELSLFCDSRDAMRSVMGIVTIRISFAHTQIAEPKRGTLLEPELSMVTKQNFLELVRILGSLHQQFASHLGLVDEHFMWENEVSRLISERERSIEVARRCVEVKSTSPLSKDDGLDPNS